ncbi:hypothetical protein NHX12_011654, partial [Muraenolepis orangiensis]
AVYVGYNKVVHLVINNLGDTTGFVRRERLEDVVKGSKWKINNLLDGEKKPRAASDIVDEALDQINTEHQYNLLLYNCEHFVTWLRYGIGESRQVQTVVAAAVVTGVGIAGLFGASLGGSR